MSITEQEEEKQAGAVGETPLARRGICLRMIRALLQALIPYCVRFWPAEASVGGGCRIGAGSAVGAVDRCCDGGG